MMKRKPDSSARKHRQVFLHDHADVQERPRRPQFPENEEQRQQAARKQQTVDGAVAHPVEAVALIEAGIEQRETEPGVNEAGPIELAAQRQIRRLARDADPDADEHHRQRDAVLPVDPPPRPVIRVPAFEGGRDVLRQLGIHRIDGNAIDDEAGRQVAQDEADRERNEGPRPHAGEKVDGQKGLKVRRQRPEQARREEQDDAEQQNTAHAEHRAEIRGCDAHEHLADAEARRDPRALVEPGREAAPQVGEPEGRDPAPERPHRRAEQDAEKTDVGPP
jgi:hypothetical protein